MKPITLEWIDKAEWDFLSARRELRVRNRPNCDLVCFLSQQCAEKYLKARLVEAGVRFPKIHNLTALLKLVLPVEPRLVGLRVPLASLNPYAVEFRYPGDTSTKEDAHAALANCRAVRIEVRKCLGLDEPPTGQMKLVIKERRATYRVRRRRK